MSCAGRHIVGAVVAAVITCTPALAGIAGLGDAVLGTRSGGTAAICSGGSTHGLGDITIGTRTAGAVPVFDTGDPETATWGSLTVAQSLTLNGTTVAAELWHVGNDATTSAWNGTGCNLAAIGGSSFNVDQTNPFEDVDGSLAVGFNTAGGDYYECATAGPGDSDSEDFAVEAVFYHKDFGSDYGIAYKKAGAVEGWALWWDTSIAYLTFEVEDAASNRIRVDYTAGLAEGWHHVLATFEQGGLGRLYLDGVSVSTANASSLGTVSTTQALGLGHRNGDVMDERILAFGFYNAGTSDWLDGDVSTDAATRFAEWVGAKLDTGGAPSTMTRASTAYLRTCDPDDNAITYHIVGDNWPRREVSCGYTWDDPTSSETTVASFLQEASATNIADFGNGLDDASWTKINSSTVTADQQNDPAGNATLDDIDGVSGSGEHGVSQAQTLTAASYVLSAAFKPGNQTFAYMDVSSIANVSAYWDSSDCQPDTVGSAATAYGFDLGDLCYLYLVYTGTAASHTHRLLCAEADGDKDYAGASGDCSYGWVGLVAASAPHSPVLTTSATDVTRSADALDYTVSFSSGPVTNVVDLSGPGSTAHFGSMYADADNRFNLFGTGTGDAKARFFGENATTNAVDITSTSDAFDETRHIVRMRWAADDAELYIDGSTEGTDTDTSGLDAPAISTLQVTGSVGAARADATVYRRTVYEASIAPGEQGTGDDTP